MKKKAKQHSMLRAARYPYVIALYLDDYGFKAYEAVEAWFGKEVAEFEPVTKKILTNRFSDKGVRAKLSHHIDRGVSGYLVFEYNSFGPDRKLAASAPRPKLARYIENPNANVSLNSKTLPLESAFVAVEREPNLRMQWVRFE